MEYNIFKNQIEKVLKYQVTIKWKIERKLNKFNEKRI